uniref:Uncharacterized protein n=1 Tax=Setaria digitata TaxID=48799 RepID=A0A915PQ97_9BILA
MPDQSVIPVFDNSKNMPSFPTSKSFSGKIVDVVEKWDSLTPPPYEVVGTVIRSPNALREVEEEVFSTTKGNGVVYDRTSNIENDKLYMHEISGKVEGSYGMPSSKHKETKNNNSDLNFKMSAGNNMTKHNSSTYSFLNGNSTVTLETTISTSSILNNTIKKIQNKSSLQEFKSDFRVIDIMEVLYTLVTFVEPVLSLEVTTTTSYPSRSDNSTLANIRDEFFDQLESQSATHAKKTFSQMYQDDDEVEVSHTKEKVDENHSVDTISIDDYMVVKSEQNHGKLKTNSNLNPQVIPRSEFAKNGIKVQEGRIMLGCDVDQIGISKGDSEQISSSNCAPTAETRFWESHDQMREKYEKEDDKSPPVLTHFEKTLWEKLIAGLKCSLRDCREALKPTESIRRYLIEPSISRARKHSGNDQAHS